jgi:hypothetical protein
MSKNTKPSTPFGHFFQKIGIWHPTVWQTLEAIIHDPKSFEADVVSEVEKWLQQLKGVVAAVPKPLLDKSGVSQDEVQHQLVLIDEWLKQLAS